MADDSTQPPPRPRRSSFAGQALADLFGTRSNVQRPENDNNNNSPPAQQYPGPISQAAAQAQRRRLSVTTLGLSGSPTSSPFNSYRGTRRESISSANSGSIDESAIEDDTAPALRDPAAGSTPATPFARRMSFGARALRDVRSSVGGNGVGGGNTGQNGTKSPPASNTIAANTAANTKSSQNGTISSRDAKGRGSADFWTENMRTRAERTSSVSGQGGVPPMHARAKSVATMEAPIREMPAPKLDKRPDHFQERILKGDFYMD